MSDFDKWFKSSKYSKGERFNASEVKMVLDCWNHQQEKINNLQAAVEELVKVVDFYAHDDMFKKIYKQHPFFGITARQVLQSKTVKKAIKENYDE